VLAGKLDRMIGRPFFGPQVREEPRDPENNNDATDNRWQGEVAVHEGPAVQKAQRLTGPGDQQCQVKPQKQRYASSNDKSCDCSNHGSFLRGVHLRSNVEATGPPKLAAKPPSAVVGPCRLDS
jgi:hypothetical protein